MTIDLSHFLRVCESMYNLNRAFLYTNGKCYDFNVKAYCLFCFQLLINGFTHTQMCLKGFQMCLTCFIQRLNKYFDNIFHFSFHIAFKPQRDEEYGMTSLGICFICVSWKNELFSQFYALDKK